MYITYCTVLVLYVQYFTRTYKGELFCPLEVFVYKAEQGKDLVHHWVHGPLSLLLYHQPDNNGGSI